MQHETKHQPKKLKLAQTSTRKPKMAQTSTRKLKMSQTSTRKLKMAQTHWYTHIGIYFFNALVTVLPLIT